MLHVLSIPSAHPYVARVLPGRAAADYPSVPDPLPPGTRGTATRLPDPVPAPVSASGEAPRPGVWWPHRGLEAGWVDEHHDLVDVVHLHFGFEGRTVAQLAEWLDVLDRRGLPLVLTVHDLDNPHLLDQRHHHDTLDLLVPRARRVLTLTPTAAAEIARRWDVEALVVPHPQIVADEAILGAAPSRGRTVGMHLGALRAGTDPTAWFDDLARAVRDRGLDLDVVANDELLGDTDERRLAILGALDAVLSAHDLAGVRHVPRMTDDELHSWVAGQAVAVLPYRHGTHSGWLEMCWDLGTPVVTPRVGHLPAQHDDGLVQVVDDGGVGAALDRALALPRVDAAERVAARRRLLAEVVATHERVYAEVTR